MSDIVIVTDSSACLPASLLERYRITLVPLAFLFDGEVYRDGQISSHEFYARLASARRLPTTTSAAPGEFLEVFRRVREGGAGAVLCLTLSSVHSGTYSAAVTAAEMSAREMPDLAVRVVDSGGIAMTHGFAVLAAARALEAGAGIDEAAAAARDVGMRTELVGALDTMRFLAMGGRVSWIAHWAASLLHIKPVLTARGEKVGAAGRARTMPRAMEAVVRYAEQRAPSGSAAHVAVMHADSPERAAELAAQVRARLSPAELLVTEFTSVMGIHTGPGFVGLAFYAEEP